MRAVKKEYATVKLIILVGMIATCFLSAGALASDYKAGSLEIIGPWSRTTPKGASTAIGYTTIKNTGTTPDRLIGGSIEVAASFQLHSMVMENGIAKMRDLKDVEIKPGQTIAFKPGGSHLMFVNLKHALSQGEHVKGTLVFEHAGTVQIEYDVAGIGAQRSPMQMDHMQH
jgi:hypothetical protein